MRVISGIHRSRLLVGYTESGIRPTMDKVKESVFAMIGDKIVNSTFLDLFGGTGSIAIEALSNGAKEVYIVDNSKEAIKVIETNINNLKINDKIKVIKDDYNASLKRFKDMSIKFDIIYIDPPYNQIKIKNIINKIIELNILNKNGIIICEYDLDKLEDTYGNLNLIKERKYGKTFIKIYK